MENLYIDAGTIIVNLLKEEKRSYLTIDQIEELVEYIYKILINSKDLKYKDIIINVNFDSIERTVWFNNNVFDLIGNTIILKDDSLPEKMTEIYKTDSYIEGIIKEYVENIA